LRQFAVLVDGEGYLWACMFDGEWHPWRRLNNRIDPEHAAGILVDAAKATTSPWPR
jgi:hypothetical protein